MATKTRKQVRLRLIGLKGNPFAVLGAFQRQAKREGWTKEEIDAVLKDAKSDDYEHLLGTIADHCIDGGFCDEDEDEDCDDDE